MPGDIFISYARKDDQAAREVLGAKGLVASLHDRLLAVFNELGAPWPTVFRDTQRIEKGDQFEPRLGQALREAKLLIVVMSRNWLGSDWCRRELDTFADHWRQRGEGEQRVKEHIFLVRKHAIPPENRPEWLQGQSGYDLLRIDPENQAELAYFDSDFGRPCDERWFTTTRELAVALRKRAQDPKHPLPEPLPSGARVTTDVAPAVVARNDRTVFLARPAADMEQSCTTLAEELTRRGFRVVPDPAVVLPMQGEEATALIDAALGKAELSIHLLGDKAGFTPEDSVPMVRLQLDRAAARIVPPIASGAEPRAFHRLIWAPRVLPGAANSATPRDLYAVLARHSGLPSDAEREEALRPGDKLDGDTLTKFSQFVLQHLDEFGHPSAPRLPTIPQGAQIYVQHHEQDAAIAETVAEGLERQGFAPLLPALEGEPAERLRVHRDALQTSDAVLLCWAEAADVWVRAGATELRRWQDLGRTVAFTCRSVLALPPQRPAKDRLRKFPPKTDVDGVIDATAMHQVTPDALDPLLQSLRPAP